jgi:hypothetical protein
MFEIKRTEDNDDHNALITVLGIKAQNNSHVILPVNTFLLLNY